MNWLVGTGFVGATALLLWMFVEPAPADVYDMPVERAYSLLVLPDFSDAADSDKVVKIRRSSTGNGSDTITWTTRGSHVNRSCELRLAPFEGDATRTHITVDCAGGGAGDGAAAGITFNMHRSGVIERIDAALTGRPVNMENKHATASRWPANGTRTGYGHAVGQAMEMDRQMREGEAAEALSNDLSVRGVQIEDY